MNANQSTKPKVIMATVYVKSAGGRSFLAEGKPPVTNVKPFLPDKQTVEETEQALLRLGFAIEAKGVTLSIAGSPELFEEISQAKIICEPKTVEGFDKPQVICRSEPPVMQIPGLEHLVEGMEITAAGVPF